MGWFVCSYPSVFSITSMAFIFLSSNERRIRAGRAGMNMNSRTRQGMVLDMY